MNHFPQNQKGNGRLTLRDWHRLKEQVFLHPIVQHPKSRSVSVVRPECVAEAAERNAVATVAEFWLPLDHSQLMSWLIQEQAVSQQ